MGEKIISDRVPIFGEIKISLNSESNRIFKVFNKDIGNLKKIDHLGILHYFLNIPKYRRYDYVFIMLYFIEKSIQANSDFNFNFKKSVNLKNGGQFYSTEELLKSWALLYSLGHFQMTFTAEHAFIRYLISKDRKEEFIKEVKRRLIESNWFIEEKEDKNYRIGDNEVLDAIEEIIENEKHMEIYKVFTLLKICENKQINNEKRKIRELIKLFILKNDYLELFSSNQQKEKLEKILNYFEIIRMLTFTILDGSISQQYLNLNYFTILENLDSFMEQEDYQTLLKDFNKFYTSNIYLSPEGSYFHHRSVKLIQENFENYDLKDLISRIIDNTINQDIKDLIKKEQQKISEKIEPHEENEENTYLNYIQTEMREYKRLEIPYLVKPISNEIENFDKNQTFGGIQYNKAKECFEVDLFPYSELNGNEEGIFNVIKTVDNFYDEMIKIKFQQDPNHILKFYGEVYEKYKSDNPESELVKTIESMTGENSLSKMYYEHFFIELINFLSSFSSIGSFVISNVMLSHANFDSENILNKNFVKEFKFPIFFRKSELILIKSLFEDVDFKNKAEKIENLKVLKEELENNEEENIYYVYAPNTEFYTSDNKKREIDLLLIKLNLESRLMEIKIGEIKPSDNFNPKQCIEQLEIIFNIPHAAAKTLYYGGIKNNGKFEIEMKSKKTVDTENESAIVFSQKTEKF